MADVSASLEPVSESALELARLRSRTHLLEIGINGLTSVLSIGSFGIPLYFVYLSISVLAGKNTEVSPALAYTAAGMVGGTSALAVFVGGWAKRAAQRKELIRLRERIAELEERLRKRRK